MNLWVPFITFGVVFLAVMMLFWGFGRVKVWWTTDTRKKHKHKHKHKKKYYSSDDEEDDEYYYDNE